VGLTVMTVTLYFVLASVTVALDLVAAVCLMQSAIYSGSQKTLQLALIWMVPLVGAILVLGVWSHDRKSSSRDPARYDEGPWLPGIGPENDHGHQGGSNGGHGGDGGSFGD
jgi:hypothetical protein